MLKRKPTTKAVLEANKVFKPVEPKPTEYAAQQKALQDNRERPRSERLARDAAEHETGGQRRSS